MGECGAHTLCPCTLKNFSLPALVYYDCTPVTSKDFFFILSHLITVPSGRLSSILATLSWLELNSDWTKFNLKHKSCIWRPNKSLGLSRSIEKQSCSEKELIVYFWTNSFHCFKNSKALKLHSSKFVKFTF
jgi:hypothetical protein